MEDRIAIIGFSREKIQCYTEFHDLLDPPRLRVLHEREVERLAELGQEVVDLHTDGALNALLGGILPKMFKEFSAELQHIIDLEKR